eukprot:4613063-Pyramimonas_sp.AAC.1
MCSARVHVRVCVRARGVAARDRECRPGDPGHRQGRRLPDGDLLRTFFTRPRTAATALWPSLQAFVASDPAAIPRARP